MAEPNPNLPEEEQDKNKVTRGVIVSKRERPASNSSLQPAQSVPSSQTNSIEKPILTKEGGKNALAFEWPVWKKWGVLAILFIVQISMNFNAAIYANATGGLQKQFHIDSWHSGLGQFAFLVAYAFCCELWAPFSEEFGRKWTLQGSLFLVNVRQLPCRPYTRRSSSAGGSVTLGIVADMFGPAYQGPAVLFIVLASVSGSVVALIVGGVIEHYLKWEWVFWISPIFGAVTQVLHYLLVPETSPETLLAEEAKRRRKEENQDIWTENEIKGTLWQRLQKDPKETCKEIGLLMWRPYFMLFTEPICLWLSLLSGFSDTLIFIGLSSYTLVMSEWGFGTIAVGLSFIPLFIGYIIAYFSFLPVVLRDKKAMNGNANNIAPERRLWWLLFTGPLLPIGLFGYAWVSIGPARGIHWIAPMIFSAVIGIANFAVYMATIDYMVAAYGPKYSASATGGNGFCRDFLAGFAALFAAPLYNNNMVSKGSEFHFVAPTMLLFAIAAVLIVPVFLIYFKSGPKMRAKSKYASEVEKERQADLQAQAGDVEMNIVGQGQEMRQRAPGNGPQIDV